MKGKEFSKTQNHVDIYAYICTVEGCVRMTWGGIKDKTSREEYWDYYQIVQVWGTCWGMSSLVCRQLEAGMGSSTGKQHSRIHMRPAGKRAKFPKSANRKCYLYCHLLRINILLLSILFIFLKFIYLSLLSIYLYYLFIIINIFLLLKYTFIITYLK